MRKMTEKIPFNEYPRPQCKRVAWLNLNGEWDLSLKTKEHEIPQKIGKILVPYSPECALSGVDNFPGVTERNTLLYEREFTVPAGFIKGKTQIVFGAADALCKVTLNGKFLLSHRGGYTPFVADATDAVKEGENTLTVEIFDPTEHGEQGRGKQLTHPSGIWYPAQSGIWQTVFLESFPSGGVEDFTIVPQKDLKSVRFSVKTEANQVKIRITDEGKEVAAYEGAEKEVLLEVPDGKPWSPESPKLYDAEITAGEDTISTYFGLRTFEVKEVTEPGSKAGKRFFLNGHPYFLSGVLDQGYYAGGLMTPPDEETVLRDLQMLKGMGFNCLRKHVKVEPARFYYLCDKLGLLVLQDFVNGGKPYEFSTIALKPFFHILYDDRNYARFGRQSEWGRAQYRLEMKETVSALKNAVSVCAWVPFNEGWGQFDAGKIYAEVKELDPTRPVDTVSGWHDQGEETSDFFSVHNYFTRLKVPKTSRAALLSEFGGYALKVPGHTAEKSFGYRRYKTEGKLLSALKKLYLKRVLPLKAKGLCGCIYTQLSDVEGEINGLVTYDRAVVKVDKAAMCALNELLTEGNERK